MKIAVAAFYADIIGKKSRFDEFLPYMLASKHTLSVTNPTASYIVLTDYTTARHFERHDIEYMALAPEHMPLMSKIVFAQRIFVLRSDADLIILPDVDCFANRDLSDSIPDNVGMAITHRGKKFEYRINNLAYIRDRELGHWFLDRAYRILNDWPLERRIWGGDQEAWEAALDRSSDNVIKYVHGDKEQFKEMWYSFDDLGNDILVSRPEGRDIYIYPCKTHNCFMNDGGIFKDKHHDSYMLHLKGTRKRHLAAWMKERFGYDV